MFDKSYFDRVSDRGLHLISRIIGTGLTLGASLVVQVVKHLPAMQGTRVCSLGGEDPLEKSMATHSSILAWRSPHGQRSLLSYSPWGHKESDTTEQLHFHILFT